MAGWWDWRVGSHADLVVKQRPVGPLASSSGFLVEPIVDGFSDQEVGVFFSFVEGAKCNFVQKLL